MACMFSLALHYKWKKISSEVRFGFLAFTQDWWWQTDRNNAQNPISTDSLVKFKSHRPGDLHLSVYNTFNYSAWKTFAVLLEMFCNALSPFALGINMQYFDILSGKEEKKTCTCKYTQKAFPHQWDHKVTLCSQSQVQCILKTKSDPKSGEHYFLFLQMLLKQEKIVHLVETIFRDRCGGL